MAALEQKIKIKQIVPRFTMKAGNIDLVTATPRIGGFSKKSKIQFYNVKGEGTFTINEFKRKIEKESKGDSITWFMLIEINDNDKEVYIKAHIISDKERRYFNSDNELNFFLKYNEDMIEFV